MSEARPVWTTPPARRAPIAPTRRDRAPLGTISLGCFIAAAALLLFVA